MRKLIIGIVTLLASVSLTGCGYNKLQEQDESVKASWSEVVNQYQRRADLIPNLVATVKGYAAHEEAVFTQVANARAALSGAIRSGDPKQQVAADAQLTGALSRLLVIAEAYPQLKADQTFLRLQDELSGTENRIAVSRSDYNAAVRDYNTYIRGFPQVITAKVTGASPRPYYDAPPGSDTAPSVDFSKPGAGK